MSDVLKQVEEALEMALTCPIRHHEIVNTLAALRDYQGWHAISEMEEKESSTVIIGQWINGTWVTFATDYKAAALAGRWTHFYRPILSAPPKEVENAG